MKIAIISDLHLTHWINRTRRLNDDMPHVLVGKSVREHKPDLIIDAGDLELPDLLRDEIGDTPLLIIPGNHDYYNKTWHGVQDGLGAQEHGGLKIAHAPLWVDLQRGDPMTCAVVGNWLNDFRLIGVYDGYTVARRFTIGDCMVAHSAHLAFMRASMPADIIVTHHAPSFKSVHPRYLATKGTNEYLTNYGFASHLDEFVEESKAKLWVHGHVHDQFDYMIGSTRVITNPCGYPHEHRHRLYEPVYVDL